MHPLVLAYVRWLRLYKLVVFGDRKDLENAQREAWEFYRELRGY